MAISKVVYEDENGNSSVWMNVTDDTVTSGTLVEGEQATGADGEKVQGEIETKTSSDLTASGATVTVPAGFYSSSASKSVTSGSATTPATSITANPSISVNSSTGLITATTSASKSVTPTVSAGYVDTGTAGTISVSGSNTSQLTTQSAKTITPTEAEQTAVASGRYTTGAVKVGAISSTYVGSGIERRDSSDLTASGATITAPAGYYSSSASKSVSTVSHPDPTISLNSSTGLVIATHTQESGYVTGSTTNEQLSLPRQQGVVVTPTESQQTVEVSGNFMLGDVTVNAISSSYVGSGITRQDSSSLTVSDATIIVPRGYYESNASKSVSTTTHPSPTASINSSTGLVTANHTQGTGYVTGGTTTGTLQLSTQGATTITPTTSSQVAVPASTFTTGAVTVGAIPSQYIVPSGTLSIASNGAFDVASYASVNVEVSGGDELDALIQRRIRGTYSNSTLSYVGSYAFAGCSELSSIDLTNVTNITTCAFSGCTSLSSINLPVVTQIGASAFAYCNGLTDVDLPSVTLISVNAFAFCYHLSSVNLPSAISIYSYAFNMCSSLATISIPNVVSIGGSAFRQCTTITEISAPNATRIKDYAFYQCSNLTTISIPNVVSIGSYAFTFCNNLTTANLPKVISAYNGAFGSCSNLTEISLPKATDIYPNAFYNCPKLTSISLPVANYIGSYAFQNCYSLSTIELPLVTSIYNFAFSNCSNLTSVSIPNVNLVGVDAFNNCKTLSFISIPNATSISGYAFRYCYNLLSVVLLGSSVVSLASTNAFMSTPISNYTVSTGGVYGSIYVPLSLVNTYKATAIWSTYSARIVGVEREFNNILTLPLSTGSNFNGLEYYLQTTGTAGILTEGETYHLEGTIIVNGTEYELDPSTTEFVAESSGTMAEVTCGNITLNFTLQSDIAYLDIWTTSGVSITLQGKTTIFGENAIAIVHNWHV